MGEGRGEFGNTENRDVEWNKIWSWDVREASSFVKMHKKFLKIHPHLVQLAQRTNVRHLCIFSQKTSKNNFFTSLKGSNKGEKNFFSQNA